MVGACCTLCLTPFEKTYIDIKLKLQRLQVPLWYSGKKPDVTGSLKPGAVNAIGHNHRLKVEGSYIKYTFEKSQRGIFIL